MTTTIPGVVNLTEAIGLAFDLPANVLQLKRHIVSVTPALAKLSAQPAITGAQQAS